jgi:DNA processing protein
VAPLGQALTRYPHSPEQPADRLSEDTRRVLDAVPVLRPATATSIARTAGLAVQTVQESLRALEQAAFVEQFEDGWLLSAP